MKQALRALEDYRKHTAGVMIPQTRCQGDEAINALRQAIEQAEKQEPVAWYGDADGFPVYAAPVHARPVVHAVQCTYPQCQATNGCVGACSKTAPVHASDISAKRVDETAKGKHWWAMQKMVEENERLGLYNEPVAWIWEKELVYMSAVAGQGITEWKANLGLKPQAGDVPLYTAPPKREWVGLTDEEIEAIYDQENHADVVLLTQAKLKEKNTCTYVN
jgi:hypothetical protein